MISGVNGDEIRAAREARLLTQGQLAQMLGVSMRTVGNWERGQSVPRNRMAVLKAALRPAGDEQASGSPRMTEATDAELLSELLQRALRRENSQARGAAPALVRDRKSASDQTPDTTDVPIAADDSRFDPDVDG